MAASTRAHDNMVLVQIEMIGFSKETPWLPDSGTLDALASLMNVCESEWGIPLSRILGKMGITGARVTIRIVMLVSSAR
jgi:hypothetical protein